MIAKKRSVAFLSALLLAVTVTGCGAPSKIYAKNAQLGVYFTVPSDWIAIPEEEIRSYELEGADAIEESDAMSYNGLRNLILPVTDLISGTSTIVDEFQLLDEQEVVIDAARGLETLFSFTPKGGANETVHQTALLSNDRKSIYFFLVRCTTECFNESEETVNAIVDSFTVKESR
ncbi:MAG: hypothetical protein EBR76_05965 [Actinobacteria bacterium]|nr:hypothetical protein [Actinomycetota bacterium]